MQRLAFRSIAPLALAVVVLSPRSASAQSFTVGTFTKPAATGAQTIAHNLGVTPSALILWTVGRVTENSGTGSYWWSFGISDGTTSRSTSASSEMPVNSENSDRRAAAKAITIVQYSLALQAEADLGGGGCTASWDATNFCLNWTNMTNTSTMVIHFIAIGGSGVQAKVVDWTTVASGPKAVTGLTFQPSVVLHFMDYDTAALPSTIADSTFMLGAMDAGGHQWASAFYSTNGSRPTTTARAQRTDSALVETNGTATQTLRATFTSMDANGFTVNFATNTTGLAYHVYSLALTGVNLWVGSFTRSGYGSTACPAPCLEPVTGLGFQPSMVLFASWMTTSSTSPATNARWGFGATDDTNEAATTVDDENNVGGSLKTVTGSREDVYAFEVLDSSNLSPTARGDIQNGTGGSFDSDGFTMDWTTNSDNVATEITYLALGPLGATAVKLEAFKATRLPNGWTRLEWRTGYEVDNVGFRVYREQNGQRVRITPSIVPGTAIIGSTGRGVSTGGRRYTWSDTTVTSDSGPMQYWLEDIDIKGKHTWHGPFAPTDHTGTER
jgi:hypothetical protein